MVWANALAFIFGLTVLIIALTGLFRALKRLFKAMADCIRDLGGRCPVSDSSVTC
jgi:hypothetical protein